VNWGAPVAAGTFNYGGLSTACPNGGVPPPMQVNFTPVTAQYIRLRALSEINGHSWTSAAEINVLGDALQPALAASATSMGFPDQLVNTSSSPLSITLSNVGFSAVGITAISTSGDFAQSNTCSTSLPVLTSCTINVSFTPQASGRRSAWLTVLNSATGALNIPLTSFGVTLHSVNLSWTASSSPVIGYIVYRATQPEGPYLPVYSVPQPQTTVTDTLPGGATYFYMVTAVGANQVQSAPSQEAAVTIPEN